jgi:hypothetical protein
MSYDNFIRLANGVIDNMNLAAIHYRNLDELRTGIQTARTGAAPAPDRPADPRTHGPQLRQGIH